jgi:predicted RecB family nuclease
MRVAGDSLVLAPTDLSSFLACRHRTGLDLAVARDALRRPVASDPFADLLQRLGAEHEERHVASLRAQNLHVVTIDRNAEARDHTRETEETLAAMRAGAEVIVQARLAHGNLAGYADILVRVNQPSDLGAWSYEPQDTKLARETKGGTILQLCAYSDLLGHMQGCLPERFHVVTPDPVQPIHSYRMEDYSAYYRMVRSTLEAAVAGGHETLLEDYYPEPVEHCAVCRWERRCHARRRADDHLSFVAGASRAHRVELKAQGHQTLAATAAMPVPVTFKPSRGAPETYNRIGQQARVQHQQRTEGRPVVERLPVTPEEGVCCLPEPSAADVFLDLEGSRFAREGGREFLFGVWHVGTYRAWWAASDAEERAAFEAVMDFIMVTWAANPAMHVYHFNHYEPTAFKRLVGRYATRADLLDRLLRTGRFVDLYPITRQAVRAGVESYSIKKMEQYTGYQRKVALESVGHALLAVELALESCAPDLITADIRDALQGYNQDDCRSTEALRDWLEGLRAEWVAEGVEVPRPISDDAEAPAEVDDREQRVWELRARLLAGIEDRAGQPEHPEHPRWLLAYLIDWHRREDNAQWWEYFRLIELQEEELLDEPKAIAGLQRVARLQVVMNKAGTRPTGSVVDRYAFPRQDIDVRKGNKLKLQDHRGFGEVVSLDREACHLDIRKGPSIAEVHPMAVFVSSVVPGAVMQESVMRLAGQALEGTAANCGLDLLYRRPPRLKPGLSAQERAGEPASDRAIRTVKELDRTTLAIQGPPGSGKTYTGASLILDLVASGKRVGVTATSHKVIVNLMEEVEKQARQAGAAVRFGRKCGEEEDDVPGGRTQLLRSNPDALTSIQSELDVLGGTAFMWARPEFAGAVDVLFVDEAGQMSLANVLAVSQAADSLVLLGDPQQLDQPQKANHPDGVGVSALEHVLDGAETMPPDRGLFLPMTHRMSPAICRFTSELFYEGKLMAKPSLAAQVLSGTRGYDGSRLWMIPVDHDGNQNASDEEVEAVAALLERLLTPEARWVDEHGVERPLTPGEIRIVAPFNAQVNRLADRLQSVGRAGGVPCGDIPVGTVDRFQGQSAAVVIYSMTTSRPEDAPRGMEFLYSLNRFNVATSRARCAVFVVCSPRLLEPECRTPRQMQLANALCRYRELAL